MSGVGWDGFGGVTKFRCRDDHAVVDCVDT
jgi:hypothetical protein